MTGKGFEPSRTQLTQEDGAHTAFALSPLSPLHVTEQCISVIELRYLAAHCLEETGLLIRNTLG